MVARPVRGLDWLILLILFINTFFLLFPVCIFERFIFRLFRKILNNFSGAMAGPREAKRSTRTIGTRSHACIEREIETPCNMASGIMDRGRVRPTMTKTMTSRNMAAIL